MGKLALNTVRKEKWLSDRDEEGTATFTPLDTCHKEQCLAPKKEKEVLEGCPWIELKITKRKNDRASPNNFFYLGPDDHLCIWRGSLDTFLYNSLCLRWIS